jgi:anti-sigma factor RsiW
MSVYEDLSRLLAGELDPGERARVEARIEAEPEVRAAWERLRTLPAQFDGLRAVPPPPARDRRLPAMCTDQSPLLSNRAASTSAAAMSSVRSVMLSPVTNT